MAIVGEVVHPIQHCLIARTALELSEIEAVVSHPQANAQCARFIRDRLPHARVLAGSSTAERRADGRRARRAVGGARQPARRRAATAASCCRAGVEDVAGNETRFVWLAPAGRAPGGARRSRRRAGPGRPRSCSGASAPRRPDGSSAACRSSPTADVNLTRIESRPRKQGLGRYMFFADLEGRDTEPHVARGARRPAQRTSRRCACSARSRPPRWSHAVRPQRDVGRPRGGPPHAPSLHCAPAMAHPQYQRQLGSASPPEHQRRGREVGRVLVLNATYEPINVCTVRRAVVLLLKEKAEVHRARRAGSCTPPPRRSPARW